MAFFADSNELTFVNKSMRMTAEIPTKKVKIYDHCFDASMLPVCVFHCFDVGKHSTLAQCIEDSMKMFTRSERE